MVSQSEKVIPWKANNYVFTILNFFIHTIILAVFIGLIIFVNAGSTENFLSYVTNVDNLKKLAYLLIFMLALITILYLYLYWESRDFLMEIKNDTLIFLVLYLCLVLSFVLGNYVSVYARPIALGALLILLLVGKRTALFFNLIFAAMVFSIDVFTNQPFDADAAAVSLVMTITVGVLAVYLIDGIGSRLVVLGMGLIIAIPMVILAVIVELLSMSDYSTIVFVIIHAFTGGLSSVAVLMLTLPVFEWLFNIVTNYRLAEITDHRSKLLKKLSVEAPGTFDHSKVVASLAESCAVAIGENPLLARAAAYYHDVGKLKQPQFFTENQHGFNPHDDITPELSTQIIRSHTSDGYELIKKNKLPQIIADVAREHHGTLSIQYFYMKAQRYTDGEIDKDNFRYPGPKPRSKIAAIVMLADGCEAAVRAHNDRSREKVENIVKTIFNDRMNEEQFSECDITMRDIDLLRNAIINALSGVYHDRINYPKANKKFGDGFGGSADSNGKK